jgi:hypothetical protein
LPRVCAVEGSAPSARSNGHTGDFYGSRGGWPDKLIELSKLRDSSESG